MLNIHKCIPAGRGLAAVLLKRAPVVTLDWELRQKSRFESALPDGQRIGVFLPRGSAVRGGDVLLAEDGTLVRVAAAVQPVLVVRACAEHGSASDLARAAYHLGNRHVAVEVQADHLKLEPDHVLAEMLRRMHLVVSDAQAPFEPEGGAYAGHGHRHEDAPSKEQHHDRAHEPGQPQGHDHGH